MVLNRRPDNLVTLCVVELMELRSCYRQQWIFVGFEKFNGIKRLKWCRCPPINSSHLLFCIGYIGVIELFTSVCSLFIHSMVDYYDWIIAGQGEFLSSIINFRFYFLSNNCKADFLWSTNDGMRVQWRCRSLIHNYHFFIAIHKMKRSSFFL